MARVSWVLAMTLVVTGAGLTTADDRHLISQKNRRFKPARVLVAPGDVVVFQNDDLTDHHIMVRKGPSEFSSRLLERGASYEVQIETPGEWTIGCRIHPRMRMRIKSEVPEPEPVP
ncbi:MAG: hypothetical protein ACFB6R_01905 [Alphaproteobacteria bacterium]